MNFRILLTHVLSLFFGLLFPAYGSITAIESPSSADDTQWLVYWLIFSLLNISESLLWGALQWLPLYQELKIALIAWLVLPQTQGALWVYENLLHPGWAFVRKELSKSPAMEKMLNRDGLGPTPLLSQEESQRLSAKRHSGLEEALLSLTARLENELKQISQIPDLAQRARAEQKFDKEISRLAKVCSGRATATPTSKLA